MKRIWIVLSLLCLLIACGPFIWFKVPQPEGAKNLSAFPVTLIANYTSVYDSALIRIEPHRIIKEYHENLILTKAEFREEVGDTISEDTSFLFTDNWNISIKSSGDSVIVNSSKNEEIFRFSEHQLLRNYKNYYFLNFKDSNEYWKVKILKLEGDTLEFDNLLTEDDLRFIRNITTVEICNNSIHDQKEYFLKPTKRELRKILKRRLQGEKFVKRD